MRRLALLACAALLLVAAAPRDGDTGWVIERFAAAIAVQADGTLRITETIDVDFLRLDDRHGIFREIPTEYRHDPTTARVFEIDVERVTDAAGRPRTFVLERNGANLRIRIGDADRIVTGKQAYLVTYRVRGALDGYPDHDELYWNVNGAGWPVPVRAVGATVRLERGGGQRTACFQGASGSTQGCRISGAGDTGADFTATRPLDPEEQLTVVVDVRKGVLPEPALLLRPRARSIEDWFGIDGARLALAAATLGGALFLVGRVWWRNGRDAAGERADVVVAEFEPPEKLRPAQLGLILDERADPKDLTASIVDLAVRGHLSIEEIEGGLFGIGKDWRLTRAAGRDALAPFETELLGGLFTKGEEVQLSALKGTFAAALDRAQRELYRESVTRGWFPADPDHVRGRWALLGVGVIVGGVVLAIALGLVAGAGLSGLGISVAGFVLLGFSPAMPRRSTAGRELLRRTLGFRRYMEVAEADRQRFVERENLFSEYLPYAIVFGCVERWAKAFEGLGSRPSTASWYHGQAGLSALALSHSLEGFSSSVSGAIVSRPGGSGFSGGSSGGGGGGGGGGSW